MPYEKKFAELVRRYYDNSRVRHAIAQPHFFYMFRS
jgi:hypothetical protein